MRNNEGGSEEDETRINGSQIVQNGHAGPGDARQLPGPQSGSQKQGQQQQLQLGPIQWDRFLPFKSLKVLLVENDNSTCQIVTALLRNCSYEGMFLLHSHLFSYLSSVLISKFCWAHFFSVLKYVLGVFKFVQHYILIEYSSSHERRWVLIAAVN
jgi:hypothetical protein